MIRPGLGYGAGIAYTFAKRETEGFNDNFSFPNPADYPKQVRNDERHRIVSNFVLDLPYLFGVQVGGLLTLGTGVRYDRGDRFGCRADPAGPAGNCTINTFDPGAGTPEQHSFLGLGHFGYRNLDLHLKKDFFAISRNRVGVTADLFNVFNFQNLVAAQITGQKNVAVFVSGNAIFSNLPTLQAVDDGNEPSL